MGWNFSVFVSGFEIETLTKMLDYAMRIKRFIMDVKIWSFGMFICLVLLFFVVVFLCSNFAHFEMVKPKNDPYLQN